MQWFVVALVLLALAVLSQNKKEKEQTIVEVKLLDGGPIFKRRYGTRGALLGLLVGGPWGAIVGGLIPKETYQKQRFSIRYSDGRIVEKDVDPQSSEYNELMKKVK